MPTFTEGIIWYLILIDCIIYNCLSWLKGKKKATHWVSEHLPLNKFMGIVYLLLVLWLGFALYRMKLLGFYL